MLMGADNRGVDHHVFVVMIAGEHLEDDVEDAASCPSVEPLVHDAPSTEALRKITPGYAGAKPKKDGFDKQPIVGRRPADMTLPARKIILDPVPLVVPQGIASHRSAPKPTTHESEIDRFGNPPSIN
jgi:hypothetical protein